MQNYRPTHEQTNILLDQLQKHFFSHITCTGGGGYTIIEMGGGGAVAEWVRALDWRPDGPGFESHCGKLFASELWQFRLPRFASVFRRRVILKTAHNCIQLHTTAHSCIQLHTTAYNCTQPLNSIKRSIHKILNT